MSRTKESIALTAGVAASLWLTALAGSPMAAADPTTPSGRDTNGVQLPAEQPKAPAAPVSLPETLKTTATIMTGIPATPALLLQGIAPLLTGIAATPAQILMGSASALSAAGVK